MSIGVNVVNPYPNAEWILARIRGCHAVCFAGFDNLGECYKTAQKILSQQRLVVSHGPFGVGAWAFYVHMVPAERQQDPIVVFDVDDKYVVSTRRVVIPRRSYSFMQLGGPNLSYVPINVLGFLNVPILARYRGSDVAFVWGEFMELPDNWFEADSIPNTLKNLIKTFDEKFLGTVSKAAFEHALVREILFLSPYRKEEEEEVVSYIHEHLDELYRTAKTVHKKKQASHV